MRNVNLEVDRQLHVIFPPFALSVRSLKSTTFVWKLGSSAICANCTSMAGQTDGEFRSVAITETSRNVVCFMVNVFQGVHCLDFDRNPG